MILFPAIDLKDGHCVRLERGDMEKATVFNDDPVAQAKAFADLGCPWLHMVDLNGAFAGTSINGDIVGKICSSVNMDIQLGGGIRQMEDIDRWLDRGVKRVILGTAAVKDPALVKEGCRKYPGQIAVGIDAKNGMVATEGWANTTHIKATDLGKLFADVGVAAIIFTDIDRDGVLAGVNIEATAELARITGLPVIASGGVASIDDIKLLRDAKINGLLGVISGRAIYDGRLDIQETLSLLKGSS